LLRQLVGEENHSKKSDYSKPARLVALAPIFYTFCEPVKYNTLNIEFFFFEFEVLEGNHTFAVKIYK